MSDNRFENTIDEIPEVITEPTDSKTLAGTLIKIGLVGWFAYFGYWILNLVIYQVDIYLWVHLFTEIGILSYLFDLSFIIIGIGFIGQYKKNEQLIQLATAIIAFSYGIYSIALVNVIGPILESITSSSLLTNYVTISFTALFYFFVGISIITQKWSETYASMRKQVGIVWLVWATIYLILQVTFLLEIVLVSIFMLIAISMTFIILPATLMFYLTDSSIITISTIGMLKDIILIIIGLALLGIAATSWLTYIPLFSDTFMGEIGGILVLLYVYGKRRSE
ncbi:hypothetical protein EU527_17970 [Candidatus Thorarchaeota archaeon]|nr:MAG: hypothetical protein EU527_17970 [Candidatus Thorarchaeota archaeon]